jgi:hypothetical protein
MRSKGEGRSRERGSDEGKNLLELEHMGALYFKNSKMIY